jgi:glutathione synthase/RimK-type ligase-like ATP-grasp enzyme
MRVALVGCRQVGTWGIGGDGDRPWERDDRALVAAFAARGAEVATPAWDDPAVDWTSFDAALLRSTWDYHHHRDRFLAWIDAAAGATRVLHPPDVVRWNTHKSYLRDLPVPQPPTRWLRDADALPEVLRAASWPRAFLKPAVGATAEGTLRFDVDADGVSAAVAHARAWLSRVDELLLQPYLAAVETRGERSAVVISGAVTHWVRKVPVPGDYRVQDDYGASDAPHAPSPAEEALVAAVLPHLPGGSVYGRVDWILGDDGAPLLVELELVEPCLFFRHGPHAADALADAVLARAR